MESSRPSANRRRRRATNSIAPWRHSARAVARAGGSARRRLRRGRRARRPTPRRAPSCDGTRRARRLADRRRLRPATSATVSTMSRKASRPAWNAATASSFAALNTAGQAPPAAPTRLASATAGKASSSSGSNVHVCAAVQSQRVAAPGHAVAASPGRARSAAACPAATPARSSSRRRTRPSSGRSTAGARRRRSGRTGTSNSRCASMTSRPLLTSVAEFVRDHQAHGPGRVRQRLRGRDVGELRRAAPAERPAGRGERRAGDLAGVARRAGTARCAECSESTGHDLAGRRGPRDERAADDQRLLVRQREGRPGLAARPGSGASPTRAGDAVEHDVPGPPARRARSSRRARRRRAAGRPRRAARARRRARSRRRRRPRRPRTRRPGPPAVRGARRRRRAR